jgi:hypothetical protein
MILQTATLLLAVGFAAFIVGHISGHPGVAMIGAIVIIGVGATAMTGGIQHQDGTTEYTNAQNETVTERTYSDISTMSEFPVGVMLMGLGAVLLLTSTGQASEEDLTVDEDDNK